MLKRFSTRLILLVLLAGLLVGCNEKKGEATAPLPEATAAVETQKLILATTTSTADSGLLNFILPGFEKQYNIEVDVIAVGTGQALTLGEDGNADVLLVHARAQEDAFMDAGHGVRREDVMYNDFVIVGPAKDPAGIRGMRKADRALQEIAAAQSPFVSRGDDSGTHSKEKSLWAAAEIELAGDWYISAGQGMGAVLTMANEQLAYTLSDRATYLAMTLEGLELEILVEGDPALFNPYGVMAVNPDKGPHIQVGPANQFIDWLTSTPTQEMIAQFGVDKFGAPLFTPDSAAWREGHGSGEAQPAKGASGDVALKITGKVGDEMGWPEADVRAMNAVDVESTNSKGETDIYTGVPIDALLEMAGVQPDATQLIYVADDGTTAEVALSDVQACAERIVSFRNKGGFSVIMPGFDKSLQVKGVIEIKVE